MVSGTERREADVYSWLAENRADWVAPRLLGVDHSRSNKSAPRWIWQSQQMPTASTAIIFFNDGTLAIRAR
jgi:hypothetical protein